MFKMLNDKIKLLTVSDIACVKIAVMFFTIMLVKFFPQLMSISYAVLIILMVAFAAKPFYKVWIKK